MKIFAERLKSLRIENKLSQMELAKAVGVSQSGLNNGETQREYQTQRRL